MTDDETHYAETTATRRKYLLGVGTALTASLAGCPSASEGTDLPSSGETDETPAQSGSPTPSGEPTLDGRTATATPPAERSTTPTTPDDASAAKQVIREFYRAANSGNFQQANSLVHPESREGTIGENQQAVFERQEIGIEELVVTDSATDRIAVRTTLVFRRDGRERTQTTDIELRVHDGVWRLYSAE